VAKTAIELDPARFNGIKDLLFPNKRSAVFERGRRVFGTWRADDADS
jgi:hypothetical protein